jgi:predicted acylesterase/phospholipase RssA
MKHFLTICLLLACITLEAQRHYNDRILVVGGGGARGAWGAGFAKFLDSIHGGYKIVYGTSTGSLMAPLIVLGKFDKLKEAYTSVTQDQIFNKNPFKMTAQKQKLRGFNFIRRTISKKKTIGESDNLLSLIYQFLDSADYSRIRNSKDSLEVGVSVVDFKTGKFDLKTSSDYNYEEFARWMWGSSNQPLFMSYTEIDSSYYVDGGVRQTIPLEVAVKYALENKIEAIDVIINKPINPILDTSYAPKSIFTGLTRLIEIWQEQIIKDNLLIGKLLAAIGKTDNVSRSDSRGGLEINYYYFPLELYYDYKNELIFDKQKMKALWAAGEKGIKDRPKGVRGEEKPLTISLGALKLYSELRE